MSTNEINKNLPSVIVSLLQDFQDVFPKEIPNGIPPLRGIDDQIDLILGATILNQPVTRRRPKSYNGKFTSLWKKVMCKKV
ncbi:Transposon Ty3-G Gag-Pol polyprotein [Gossypium australe]|uniref:Transposon Ty3-G Gag-Pol polyprotein n=1 Tax=Gossypium australe TaxID=47621 RepID=A0A5B6WH09_9ROSI|nr:Transposon Ty3-G Gag-Pol polyprotein [Gossypium australe]